MSVPRPALHTARPKITASRCAHSPPVPGISGRGQHPQPCGRIAGRIACEVTKVAEDRMNR
jgi:hypothetical protein